MGGYQQPLADRQVANPPPCPAGRLIHASGKVLAGSTRTVTRWCGCWTMAAWRRWSQSQRADRSLAGYVGATSSVD
jgi:hypothetical protein